MGERTAVERAGCWIGGKRRSYRPLGDINLALWKIRKRLRRHAEIFGEHLGRRVSDPIGDGEGPELGEITVVENEHEETILRADALDRVPEPARKVPHVPRPEVDDLGMAVRVDGRDAALALDEVGPFSGIRV